MLQYIIAWRIELESYTQQFGFAFRFSVGTDHHHGYTSEFLRICNVHQVQKGDDLKDNLANDVPGFK